MMAPRKEGGDMTSLAEVEQALAQIEAGLERIHARLVEANRARRAESAEKNTKKKRSGNA